MSPWHIENEDLDIRSAMPIAKAGRFFNDAEALKAAIERATYRQFEGKDISGGETPATVVLKAYAHSLANLIAERTLQLHDQLEARIAELEAAPLEYTGVHRDGQAYRKNQFATYAGSVWCAKCETIQRPGDGNDWQLAVKAGRDGK